MFCMFCAYTRPRYKVSVVYDTQGPLKLRTENIATTEVDVNSVNINRVTFLE